MKTETRQEDKERKRKRNGDKTRKTWREMLSRCLNKNNHAYGR